MKKIPTNGIVIFAILYLYSASLYPGGSQENENTIGFDWVHNYWCDLLHFETYSHVPNPAEPFAILAMVILCLSLSYFFYEFPKSFDVPQNIKRIIQFSGSISMAIACLVFTDWHNIAILISSIFGFFALLCMFYLLIKFKWKKHLCIGVFCCILMFLNNYFYYSGNCLYWLPLLQKVTFFIVLGWIILLNFKMRD